jgi:hypothetical protein
LIFRSDRCSQLRSRVRWSTTNKPIPRYHLSPRRRKVPRGFVFSPYKMTLVSERTVSGMLELTWPGISGPDQEW